jgi:hypothetical protein
MLSRYGLPIFLMVSVHTLPDGPPKLSGYCMPVTCNSGYLAGNLIFYVLAFISLVPCYVQPVLLATYAVADQENESYKLYFVRGVDIWSEYIIFSVELKLCVCLQLSSEDRSCDNLWLPSHRAGHIACKGSYFWY